MSILANIADMLFPQRCIFCRKFLKKEEVSVCKRCSEELPFTHGDEVSQRGEAFDVCISPLHYRDYVCNSILRFKFHGATFYADYYGVLLANCIKNELKGKFDLITWVPLSSTRASSRGYDQAMLLALATALELDDVAVELLRKTTDVKAQSSLNDRFERKANISGAYEVVDSELVNGKRILLIDDIVTSGATLSECARTLRLAGATSVLCATLARA